jgi:TIR domain-containing protein
VTSENQRIVFISYSHGDSEFVNSFAAALLKYDLQIWKDSKDIPIGGNIPKSIYSGIKNASHFCCIISASSVSSKWVEDELSFAKIRQLGDSGLQIVPVLIDKVEIPDYVIAYLCAHLEDRDLSITNAEFLKVLKAFGTDLEEYSRNVITGKPREALLESCEALRGDIALLREWLGKLDNADIRHQAAISNRAYDPPDGLEGLRRTNPKRRPTTYGSDHRIAKARHDVVGILKPLRESASRVQASLELLRQSWHEADPSRTVSALLVLLYDLFDRVSYISRTVSDASDVLEENWWIDEKLSEWLEHLAAGEVSIVSAITLLRSWASFDPT